MVAPKLRFKEFSRDWEESTIYNLSKSKKLNNGVFNDTKNAGTGYKLINVLDMYLETSINEKKLQLLQLTDKEFKNNQVFYGDIFFTRSSLVKEGIAHSNVYLGHSHDITYDGHLIKFSPDLSNYSPIFLNFLLKTSKVRKQLVRGGKTATMTTIGQNEVGNTILDYPSLEEQTKIANFLTKVDQKIEQLTQKHELLTQYKKGMMQKLFSQHIRFKADDGSEFREWERKKLGNLYDIGSSKRVLQKDWQAKGIPFLRTREIISMIKKTPFSTPIFISEALYKELTLKYGAVKKDDLLISGVGTVGQAYHVKENDKFYFKDGNVIWLKYKNLTNSVFINYFFQSHIMMQYFLSNKAITTVDTFTIEQAKKIRLCLPTLPEQTKIANFLSSIDQKIDLTHQQLQQAKQWKKGLLQHMFV